MSQRIDRLAMLLLIGCLVAPSFSSAQFGGRGGRGPGGGGGGPGGFGGSRLSVLEEESVATELGLSDDQKSKIAGLIESSRPDFSQMMPLMMQMRSAETDEQRSALREQLGELTRAPAEKAEAELKSVLSDKQFTRYVQARRQRTGIRGLMDTEEAEALGLSDAQQQQLDEKARELFSQLRDLRRLPEDEQQAAREKMEADLLAVLTDDQRKKWEERLGPPIEGLSSSGRGGGGRPDRGDGARRSSAPQATQPAAAPIASLPGSSTPAATAPMADTPTSGQSSDGGDPLDDMLGALEAPAADQPAPTSVNPNAATLADFGKSPADGPANQFSFNFRNAPWQDVLTLFAQLAGYTLDPSTMPPGAFEYYDNNTYTPEEAINVMNGYLLPRGFLLVKRDKFLVVRDISAGIPPSLIPTITVGDLARRGGNELVRVIFDTGQTPAAELVDDVRAMLGAQGTVVAMAASNRLVAEGLAKNLLEVHGLLQDATRPVGPDGLAFRAFRLEHINARDVEPLIKSLLGVDSGFGSAASTSSSRSRSSSSSSGDPRSAFIEMMRSRMGGGGGPPSFGGGGGRGDRGDRGGDRGGSSSSGTSGQTATAAQARVAIDDRTNTVLVTAKPSDLDIVGQAVEELDVESGDARNAGGRSTDAPVLRVYDIDRGDLSKISETLTAMVPGIAINSDDRADQIHVVATPDKHREVAEMVSMITGDTVGHTVTVIPLSRMDAYSAGQIVANMFAADEDGTVPSVQADPTGQRLIVRGSASDVSQVRSLLLQLGETGEPVMRTPANRGPVRELPLNGSDPAQTLRLLQQLWDAGHEQRLEVVPSGRGRSYETSRPNDQPTNEDPRASLRGRFNDYTYVVQEEPASSADAQAASESAATKQTPLEQTPLEQTSDDAKANDDAPNPRSERRPISATIIGDRLVISSPDLDSLDDLEALAARLLTQTQSRTRWTVIYLQVADATETATMLSKFFPEANIGSGILPTNPGAMTPTGQSLQIIPEVRTNALFVAGSSTEIEDVKEVLRILDSSEVPTAYRDRVARSIPVEYANAGEVAEILTDVFADMLTQENENRGSSRFGGGNGSSATPGQLSIGVDVNTSRIVVSSNEALFRQVESVVQELDEAAREARRSVKVINLQNTNPAAVKSVLGTILPQVTFTTSSSRTSTSRSSSGGGDRGRGGSSDSSSGSDNPFDFFRRMREARERGESGGGGSGFGGRPSFGGFGGGGPGGGDRGRPGGERGRR